MSARFRGSSVGSKVRAGTVKTDSGRMNLTSPSHQHDVITATTAHCITPAASLLVRHDHFV
jgi:hypothetical protein